jgi:hypothetical protein
LKKRDYAQMLEGDEVIFKQMEDEQRELMENPDARD